MTESRSDAPRLLIGNYSSDSAPGQVAVVELGDGGVGKILASTPLPNPSFVTVDGNGRVSAALEEEVGKLVGLGHVDSLAAKPTFTVESGGSIPCHVSSNGEQLGVAHYGDGAFTIFAQPVQDDAAPALSERLLHEGSGPVSPDQDHSRAHQSVPVGEGFLVSNLGADLILEYQPGPDGTFEEVDAVTFPAGAGPRHMALAGQYVFVVGELDSRLHVLRRDEYGIEYRGSQPTVEAPGVKSAPSHVAFGPDNTFLYVANRFRDTIAVFDTRDLAQPELVGEFSCGGHIPRHFHITEEPDQRAKILIANQGSDSIDTFELKPYSGFLGKQLQSLPWQRPSCIAPVPSED